MMDLQCLKCCRLDCSKPQLNSTEVHIRVEATRCILGKVRSRSPTSVPSCRVETLHLRICLGRYCQVITRESPTSVPRLMKIVKVESFHYCSCRITLGQGDSLLHPAVSPHSPEYVAFPPACSTYDHTVSRRHCF
jgi:hypothetical protein